MMPSSRALMCAALISCICIAPMARNTSASKYRSTRAAWFSFQRRRLSECQRRAMDSKVFRAAALRSSFSCCLAALGSWPSESKRRAFSAAWRASERETAGYLPMVSVFSLPSMRYFRRKILPPAGVTSRYRPPPSNSLAFFPASVGLAFLIWRSFRGIFGVCFRGYFQMPPNIPLVFALLNYTAICGIGQSGRGKQDDNRPASPVVIGFGLWHWTVLDKK